MNRVRRCVEVDRPPSDLWAVLEDVSQLPRLSPGTKATDGPAQLKRAGQTFTQTVELGGRSFTSDWVVREIDPGRWLVIEGRVLPGTRYRMTEELEQLGPDRTRICLVMEYKLPFGPLGRLAARLGVERRAVSEAEQVLAGVARLAGGVPTPVPRGG